MNEAILAHFHPDERPFVERMAKVAERAADRHRVELTDFLDPRQAAIADMLVRRHPGLHALFAGGHPGAERMRAVIAPSYIPLDPEDARLALIRIVPIGGGAEELEHGDYLGALLGLGIKRDKIGDLHVSADECQCVVAAEMADYIDLHLRKVHRVPVTTERLPVSALRPVIPETAELTLSVASLRLDAVAGDVWRLSRARVLEPIRAGRCRVNWMPVDDPARPLREGDTVSMRGFGRFRLVRVDGETKSGRLRITVAKFG